jgi:hypothetical protein
LAVKMRELTKIFLVKHFIWNSRMEIIETRAALLSNYEVLQLLNERIEGQKQRRKEDSNIEYPENLRTIQFEVFVYEV